MWLAEQIIIGTTKNKVLSKRTTSSLDKKEPLPPGTECLSACGQTLAENANS